MHNFADFSPKLLITKQYKGKICEPAKDYNLFIALPKC